jgi:predicted flap endonuclease-1-like 5' DNA nuclease
VHALPGEQINALHGMLRSQADTVETLNGLLNEQGIKLNGLEQRIERIDDRLEGIPSAEDHGTLVALIQAQSEHLDRRLSEFSPGGDEALRALVQTQADRLLAISTRLDQWAAAQAREDERLAEHARLLAALDREMAEQAQIVQQLDARAGEHTTMLITAANERREQSGLLDRTMQQLAQLFPLLNQLIEKPPRPGQDRLTDIIGIGPAFSGKLYEAGIHTFRQLAAMTPEEINTLINVPKWRAVDAESWIEQAKLLASQREKVEHIT